jgi:hypothetical protein
MIKCVVSGTLMTGGVSQYVRYGCYDHTLDFDSTTNDGFSLDLCTLAKPGISGAGSNFDPFFLGNSGFFNSNPNSRVFRPCFETAANQILTSTKKLGSRLNLF